MKKYLQFTNLILFFVLITSQAFGAETISPETADQLAELQKNMDYIWVLTAAALVFLMQAGFMCLESGMARAKNSINVAIKNMADFISYLW